jgi:hypothetical protein
MGLPLFMRGKGAFRHLSRLDVGESAEHLLKFRQVREFRAPAPPPQALAVRADSRRLDDFTESARPGTEIHDSTLAHSIVVESLHNESPFLQVA